MTHSRSALADALDQLAANGRVVLTESRDRIAVNQLSGSEATRILALLEADGWPDIEAEDAAGALEAADIQPDDHSLRITAGKPGIAPGVEAILTRTGFKAALMRTHLADRVWVHGLAAPFETISNRFAPWSDSEGFLALEAPTLARRIVRVLDENQQFPDDLGRWLLRKPDADLAGPVVQIWRHMALDQLARALADEIEPGGGLLFRGPPVTRFTATKPTLLEQSVFEDVQRAGAWVFENSRELENRHILLAAEVARASGRSGTTLDLAQVLRPALEGARIAYNFGVTQQSRDTLKALSDLRRSVSDETTKMGESTRALSTAIAGSVFANIGIIVARLTVPAEGKWVPAAAILLGLVLAIYVATMIVSGIQHLALQEKLRTEWRERLYKFLDNDEYDRMVVQPADRAKEAFTIVAWAGGIMAALLFVAVLIIAGSA